MIQACSAPQNDRLNFSFEKDTYVDGEKLARNGQKTATYYSTSFPPHYRMVLISHLLVFNLWSQFVKITTSGLVFLFCQTFNTFFSYYPFFLYIISLCVESGKRSKKFKCKKNLRIHTDWIHAGRLASFLNSTIFTNDDESIFEFHSSCPAHTSINKVRNVIRFPSAPCAYKFHIF